MPHCAAFGCNFQSEGNKGSDVRLHSFPTGKKRRKQWEDACGRTQLPKDPRLCSLHFSPDLTRVAGYKRRRKLNALPTIFPHKTPKHPWRDKRRSPEPTTRSCSCRFGHVQQTIGHATPQMVTELNRKKLTTTQEFTDVSYLKVLLGENAHRQVST
uniref:THAP domain-containing protein 1 n=1 Tax=Nothobranchius furzeri TaxID=105023 RepID=A0A8C6KYH9_NOTFU